MSATGAEQATSSTSSTRQAIDDLTPWFHNLHLPGGEQTAPGHEIGDFPRSKWVQIAPHIPEDLSGWRVLDIGCNAGFYTFALAQRGAVVLGIDVDEHYLRQARWALQQFNLGDRVRFQRMQIYNLAHLDESFDLVWFMGVFYHLRYPLLGLDLAAERTRRMMVFQSLSMPGKEIRPSEHDLPLDGRDAMLHPGWPKMAFIEHRLAHDPTNWWAPNAACTEAMLRTAGLRVAAQPGHEIYVCERDDATRDAWTRKAVDAERRAATGR